MMQSSSRSSGSYIFKVSFDLLQSEKELRTVTTATTRTGVTISLDRFVSCFNEEDINTGDKVNALLYVLPSLYRILSQSIDTSNRSTNNIVDKVLCETIFVAIHSILLRIAANSEMQHAILLHTTGTPGANDSKSHLLQVLNNVILLITFLMEGVSKAANDNPDAFEDVVIKALRVYNAYMTALLCMATCGHVMDVRKYALSAQIMPQIIQTFLLYCSFRSSGVRTLSALNTTAAITFVNHIYEDKNLLLAYFPGIFSKLQNVLIAKTKTDSKTRSYCLVAIMTLYKFVFICKASGVSSRITTTANHLDFIKSLQIRGTSPKCDSIAGGNQDVALLSFEKANTFFVASFSSVFNASSIKTQVILLYLLRDTIIFVLGNDKAFAINHFYSYVMLLLPSINSDYAPVKQIASDIYQDIRSSHFSDIWVDSRLKGTFLDNFISTMKNINSKANDLISYPSLNLSVLNLISIMQFLSFDVAVVIKTSDAALTKLFETLLASQLDGSGGGAVLAVDSKMYKYGPNSFLGKYYRIQSNLADADIKRTIRKFCYMFGNVETSVNFLADNIVKYNLKTKDVVAAIRRRGKFSHYYIQKSVTLYAILNFAYFGFVHKWLNDCDEARDPFDLLTSPSHSAIALADANEGTTPIFIFKIVGINSSIIKNFIESRDQFESCLCSYSSLISLVLENIASIFYYFGRQKRESLLLIFLYDIIVLTSDSSTVVSTAAETTLHLISMYLDYPDLPFMLLDNFDFLIEKSYAKFKIQKQTLYDDANFNATDMKNVAFYNSFHILNLVFDQVGNIVKNDNAETIMYNKKIRLYVIDLLKDIMKFIDFNNKNFVVSNLQTSSFLSLINIIFTKIINILFIHHSNTSQTCSIDDSIEAESYFGGVLKLTNSAIRSFTTSNIAVTKITTTEKRHDNPVDDEFVSDGEDAPDTRNDEIVSIMLDTLKRLIYFMTLENLRDRVSIIQVIYEMIKVLKENNIQRINNIVYQIWPNIIEILKIEVTKYTRSADCSSDRVIAVGPTMVYRHSNAGNIVISRTLDLCSFILFSSGDFFSGRFDEYLLPIVSRLLSHFFAIESNFSRVNTLVDYKKRAKSLRLTNDFEILLSLLKLVEGLVTKNSAQFNFDYVAYFLSFLIPFLSLDQTDEVRRIVFKIIENFVSLDYTYSLFLYNLINKIASNIIIDSKTVQWTDILQKVDVISFLSNPKLRRAIELANGSSSSNNISTLTTTHFKNLVAIIKRKDEGVLERFGDIVSKQSQRSFDNVEVKSHMNNTKWLRELISRSYL